MTTISLYLDCTDPEDEGVAFRIVWPGNREETGGIDDLDDLKATIEHAGPGAIIDERIGCISESEARDMLS